MLVLFLIACIAIGCLWGYFSEQKRSKSDTKGMGGIEGIYPKLTRFVKDRYDRTQVLKEKDLSIETKSSDYKNDRNVFFRLFLDHRNKKVKIKCEIEPNDKNDEKKVNEFTLDPKFGAECNYEYGEQKAIKEMSRWLEDPDSSVDGELW